MRLIVLRSGLLPLFCPGYWRDFPKKPEPGPWMVCSVRTSPFTGKVEVDRRLVRGDSQEAYVEARALALRLDLRTPHADGELGVEWGVRRPTLEELGEAKEAA